MDYRFFDCDQCGNEIRVSIGVTGVTHQDGEDTGMAMDMFDAASKIAEQISGLSEDQTRKAVQMALVGVGRSHVLVDPQEIEVATERSKPLYGRTESGGIR